VKNVSPVSVFYLRIKQTCVLNGLFDMLYKYGYCVNVQWWCYCRHTM